METKNLSTVELRYLGGISIGAFFGGIIWVLINKIKHNWAIIFALLFICQLFVVADLVGVWDGEFLDRQLNYDSVYSDDGKLYYNGFEIGEAQESKFITEVVKPIRPFASSLSLISIIPLMYLAIGARKKAWEAGGWKDFVQFKRSQQTQDACFVCAIGIIAVFLVLL